MRLVTFTTLCLSTGLALAAVAVAADKGAKKPKTPAWTDDPDKMEVPDAKASGKIHGKPFTVQEARLENGVLTLRRGTDLFPDLAVDVMLWIKQDEKPEGKKVTVTPDQTAGVPLIRLQWRDKPGAKGGPPKQAHFKNGYALLLEMGDRTGDRIAGKIYICLPDDEKSVVAGTFEAVEKNK